MKSTAASAPRPFDEEAALADIARLMNAGAGARAEELAWTLVRRRNPGQGLGKRPRTPVERALRGVFLSHALLRARLFARAAREAGRALADDPTQADAAMIEAAALYQNGNWEEAVPAARRALALRPTLAPTLALLLQALLDLGRVREAEAEARGALARLGTDPDVARAAAGALVRRGHVDEARAALERLGSHPQRGPEFLALAAQALTTHGRHGEALPLYRVAAARAPRLAEAHAGLIACLHAQGREAEATQARERALRALPRFSHENFDFHVPLSLTPCPEPTPDEAPAPLDPTRALLVNGIGVLPARPLGIAQIKGAVEANGAFQCALVDLNALVYRDFIRALRQGETDLEFDGRADLDDAFARMEQLDPLFVDPEGYKTLAPRLLMALSLTGRTLQGQFERAAQGRGPVSWVVEACAAHLLAQHAAVIGFSLTFTDQLPFTLQCARLVKARRPETVVVFGGGFFKDSNLEGFLAEPCVDAVILGEGEGAFLALLEAHRDGRPLSSVPGVVRHDPDTETITRQPNTATVRPGDLPFADFGDTPADAYLTPVPVVPILSSRGCYWRRCTFCNHFASYAASYKAAPVARVVDELAHHVARGIRHFTFVDEMIPALRLRKLSEAILERGLDLRFYALAKPTADFTAETLALMRKAGCVCLYWGLESGSDRVLARMDKGNDVAGSARTLTLSAEAGIRNHVFLIVGFPGETRTDLRATLDFLHAHQDSIHAAVAGPFVLEPGTPIHAEPERFDIRHVYPARALCDSRLADYDIDASVRERLTQAQAARYADILRPSFFDTLSAYGPCLGTPRDHVVALYEHGPASLPPRAVPDPAEVWPLLEADMPRLSGVPDFVLTPRWRSTSAPDPQSPPACS
ncbi:B12-binding domain-containing radical SAM protein [Pararhodospirillum oryzae]|uniref:B12-binding domain-containing radical SAM protein n=1 Tax=Pararhodospirillum oryzae TaxID=478448 RepID=A0A512H3S1_9PROT|nr:radical SAM protein [Pararhodospirillum oryzae]GEO80116.1 hypothetical protein ROR02_02470 [Pararhodospirillum oryzae]